MCRKARVQDKQDELVCDLSIIKGIRLYKCTNKCVCVGKHVGALLCCSGVHEYTHTHISFDLGVIWVGVVL